MASSTDAATLIVVLEAQSRKLQSQLVQAQRQIDAFASATERRFAQMSDRNAASFAKLGTQLKSSTSSLTSMLGPLTAAFSIKELVDYSNTWETLENKLRSAATYAGLVAAPLTDIAKNAMAARTPLEQYVTLYSRLMNASVGLHLSEQQVAESTDLISKAFKISGATAAQQAGGIIQITEALGTNLVQGRQLRSLETDAITVSQALAAHFGTTVGGLKKLGTEGKITGEVLVQSLHEYSSKINAAFNATSGTISDAITNIETAFTVFVGTQGEASGAIQTLTAALNYLAQNFQTLAPVVIDFVSVVTGALIGKAVLGMVVGFGEALAALATFLAALSAGEVTVAIFSAALGPIALLASGAAVALGYLIYAQGEAARAADMHSAALKTNLDNIELAIDGSQRFRDSLKKNVEVQLQAAEAANEEAKAQLAAAASRVTMLEQFAGVPVLGGMASGAAGYQIGLLKPQEDTIAENEKFIAKLKDQLTQIDTIMKTPAGKDAGGDAGGGDKKANAFQQKWDSTTRATEVLASETDAQSKLNVAVNDYGRAAETAKMKNELLNSALDAKIPITASVRSQIDFLANGYADASVKAKQLTDAQTEAKKQMDDYFATAKDSAKTFIDDLVAGKTAVEALGDAFSKIGSKLEDMGLNALFGTGGSNSTNPYGVLGQLFFHADGGVAAHGKPVPLKKFANGGVSNTAAIFGEAGPEAAIPLKGGMVPVDLRMPKGGMGGPVTVHMPISIDATGADPATLGRVQVQVATLQAELPSLVVKAYRDAKRSRQL